MYCFIISKRPHAFPRLISCFLPQCLCSGIERFFDAILIIILVKIHLKQSFRLINKHMESLCPVFLKLKKQKGPFLVKIRIVTFEKQQKILFCPPKLELRLLPFFSRVVPIMILFISEIYLFSQIYNKISNLWFLSTLSQLTWLLPRTNPDLGTFLPITSPLLPRHQATCLCTPSQTLLPPILSSTYPPLSSTLRRWTSWIPKDSGVALMIVAKIPICYGHIPPSKQYTHNFYNTKCNCES